MKWISIIPKNVKGRRIVLWLLCLLIFGATAMAPDVGPYEISWYMIDSGGGISSGGPYMLTGTIGQPFVGFSAGGEYELFGDIWSDEPVAEF